MASETSILISIGAAVGGAVAGLGSVDAGIQRLGAGMVALKRRKDAVGSDFVGPRTAVQLARANAEALKLGRSFDQLKAKQAALSQNKQIGDALRQQRQDLKGEAMGIGAAAATLAVPVKLAIDFESAMADVKKVVEFDAPDGLVKLGDELLRMTRTIPINAQGLAAIAASGGQLGVAARDLPQFTETIAKMSVAFDMLPEEAGDSMAKLANVYRIPIAQIGKLGDAINQLSNESPAKARDIVQALGRVGGVAKQFGLTELQAASLSNAFIALGKPPEVAGTAINAMLIKLQTADKQGAKFQAALKAVGMSATGLKQSIGKDAQGALVGFLGALEKVPASDRTGLLVDLFGLEYADDVAVLAGSIKTYTDSIDTLQKKGSGGKLGFLGSMDREFGARRDTTGNQFGLLKNNLSELGIVIGSAVLPAVNDLLRDISPMVIGFANWAKENRGLVGSIMKGVALLVAFKAGSLGVRLGLNLLSTFANSAARSFLMLSGRLLFVRSVMLLKLGPMTTMLRLFGMGTTTATLWAGRLVRLGAVLGGALLRGLTMAGRAVLFLGRALLMNPIGLIITGIAVAGYLIYRNWAGISAFFKGLWGEVKAAAAGGVGGITKLIVNWSPIGLFYKAMRPVLAWMGIDLPAKFTDFGGMLIDGLVSGISAKFGAAKSAIMGLGSSIKTWFANTLGIKSPSRVFLGFGDNIGAGAQIGILNRVGSVAAASGKLAKAARGAMAGAAMAGAGAAMAGGAGGGAGGAGGGMNITYSPTITITVQGAAGQSAGGSVEAQVQKALGVSQREFETMLNRVLADRQRRGY